jgi:hypothetical protein
MARMTKPLTTLACACAVAVFLATPVFTAPTLYAQGSTPTEAFNAYRKALSTATTYGELLPFMEPNGRKMIESMPPATQARMFELLQKFAGTFRDVKVTKESVTGETAILELTGTDPNGQPATGSVPMTRDASGWKVGTEKWSSKPR